MFDGSVPWSVGVGEGEWSWRALGAPKRLSSDGFVMIDGVFVVAVGVSVEEGGEWPRGGGRGADAWLDGRLEFFGARRVAGCALADAGLDGFFKACLGSGGGRWYAGRVKFRFFSENPDAIPGISKAPMVWPNSRPSHI